VNMNGQAKMQEVLECVPSVKVPTGTEVKPLHKNSLKGLKIGWERSSAQKLPPKPCLLCGKDVFYKRANADTRKFCSRQCKNIFQTGKNLIRKIPRTGKTIICTVCGKEFYKYTSEIEQRKRRGCEILYCSIECRIKGGYTRARGEECSWWKGGIQKDRKGYLRERVYTDHPYKQVGGHVMQHRLVMEKHIGRFLLPTESVHHKNGIKDDNRIENLELIATSPHIGKVHCPHCNKEFTIR